MNEEERKQLDEIKNIKHVSVLDAIQEYINKARLSPSYTPCYLWEIDKIITRYLGKYYKRSAEIEEAELAQEAKKGRYRGGW